MNPETLQIWQREFRIPSRWTGDWLRLIDTGRTPNPEFRRLLETDERFRDMLAVILDTLIGGRRLFYNAIRKLGIQL